MDAQMRKKRNEILDKINALSNKCTCETAEDYKRCNNCKKLQSLGLKLNKLVNKRAQAVSEDGVYLEPKTPVTVWTKEKTEQIKREYQHYTYTELAKRLKVSRKQLTTKMYRMGLKCEVKPKIFKFYEDDVYICEGSLSEISELTGYRYTMLHKYVRNVTKNKRKRLELVK